MLDPISTAALSESLSEPTVDQAWCCSSWCMAPGHRYARPNQEEGREPGRDLVLVVDRVASYRQHNVQEK